MPTGAGGGSPTADETQTEAGPYDRRLTNSLPLSEPPYPDESFRGWVRRLALVNGYDRPDWITPKAPTSIGRADIVELAQLTRVSEPEIERLCYSPLGKRSHRFGFTRVGKRHLQLGSLKICPLCLGERAVHRMPWDLVTIQVCPTHQCKLLDACPKCGQPATWTMIHSERCSCDYLVTTFKPNPLNTSIEATTLICDSLRSGEWHSRLPEKLRHLTLGEFTELMLIVARYDGMRCSRAGYMGFNHKLDDIFVALETGWTIVKDWPNGVYSVFDRLRKSSITNLADAFGPFYQALLQNHTGAHWLLLRDAFQQFVRDNWRSALPARKDRLIDISSLPITSLAQAAKTAGYSWRTAKGSLNNKIPFHRGRLTSTPVPLPPLPLRCPTASQLSKLLGLTVCRADVLGLQMQLIEALTANGQGHIEGIPLRKAWRKCNSRGITKRQLIEALLQGRLPFAANADGLYICPQALSKLFFDHGKITFDHAATLLQVRHVVVAALVKMGILVRPLSAPQLAAFQAEYVFAHHLAKSLNTNLRLLNRTLASANVMPLRADQAALYLRKEVAELNLPSSLDAASTKRAHQGWSKYKREYRIKSKAAAAPKGALLSPSR